MSSIPRLFELPQGRLLAEFSLWSADLGRLEEDVARVDEHVDLYHVDVADGHFAPALLYFPDLMARLRPLSKKPFHVHLMVDDAILLAQAEQFAEAGADLISVHAENANWRQALELIARLGRRGGVVLRVETPVDEAKAAIEEIDMLTLLGTAIGVKGQGLSPTACPRLQEARALATAAGRPELLLAADGGIRENTVPDLRRAGADTVVMGSLAFGASDLAARMAWLHGLPAA